MKNVIAWVKAHKIASIVIFLVLLIVGAVTSPHDKTKQSSSAPSNKASVTTSTTKAPATATPNLNYNVTEDKNTYVGVVVPSSYDNVATMKQLGTTLKNSYGNRSHVFVYVFDDQTAASYLDAVLQGNETSAQDSVYDPHFVAEYQRNQPTNFNQFTIQLNGGDKDSNPVTIKY